MSILLLSARVYPHFPSRSPKLLSFLCSFLPHWCYAPFYHNPFNLAPTRSAAPHSHLASDFSFLFSLRSINSPSGSNRLATLKHLNKPLGSPAFAVSRVLLVTFCLFSCCCSLLLLFVRLIWTPLVTTLGVGLFSSPDVSGISRPS
jgi:hypothetical protein